MIRLALFDLGKVLIDFDFAVAIQRIRKSQPLDLFKVKALFQNSDVARSWDKGLIAPEEFYRQVTDALNLKTSKQEFQIIWNEIFTEKREMIEFALSLCNGRKVSVISNTNPWHAEHIRRTYPWIHSFNHFIASCDVHLLKPDPRIFQIALDRNSVAAEETLYVDDLQENVSAAREMGMRAILFQGHKSLLSETKSLRLE